MRNWWGRLGTFWRVTLIVVAVLVVIWVFGFVVLGCSTSEGTITK